MADRPIPVAVTRPKLTWGEVLGKLLTGTITSLVVAWALMLILGALFPQAGWSYLQALLLLLGVRLLQNGSGSGLWTHKAKGSAL